MSAPEHIVVGKVTTAYGLKGWVKIHSFTEPDTNVLAYQPLYIGDGAQWRPALIEQGKAQGRGLVVKFEGCNDRNQAELLAGQQLAIGANQLPPLEEGEVYWRQLEGLLVYSLTEAGEVLLGRVDGLIETGANDVIVVKPVNESIDQRERLVPFVRDDVIVAIDLDGGTLRVNWDPEF